MLLFTKKSELVLPDFWSFFTLQRWALHAFLYCVFLFLNDTKKEMFLSIDFLSTMMTRFCFMFLFLLLVMFLVFVCVFK